MSSSSSSFSNLFPPFSPKKNEDKPHSEVNPLPSNNEKKEGEVAKAETFPSAKLPLKKRSRMWADSEDEDDDEEEEEEEDESSSSAGYPPTKRFRSWADSEDDDDDEEEEAPAMGWGSSDEELPGSSADDIDGGDDEDSDD
jgi:hypothetical protein